MSGVRTAVAAPPAVPTRLVVGEKVPAPGRSSARWTLRRRLVAVLIVLLVTVTGTMGVGSALALRGSLIGQVDSQLIAATGSSPRA